MSALIEVKSVNLYPLENCKNHHTDKYELVHDEEPTSVLRRGEPFKLSITFKNRPYSEGMDKVRVIFNYGKPGENRKAKKNGAWVTNAKELAEPMDVWTLRRTGQSGLTLFLEMRASITAPVGAYNVSVKTSLRTSGEIKTYDDDTLIYLLFNPWNKSDMVYMPKERLLDEYVLNDVGKIWVGPLGTARGRHWVFGQFSGTVLKACQIILEKIELLDERKGIPILVTRAISKLVNTLDEDGGVLEGRWDGEYDDGTPPSMWTGSIPILQLYAETDGGEVKYGQCWVFAGVVTTVCRALGIPSRVVSNIVSAHDANASLTIDTFYSTDNEEISDPFNDMDSGDSIWNFHVWNDVWMARPDLPSGYGGWQAIDATPQETSDGVFQCGPASVEAVRTGEIGLKYDVPFVLSSVNADMIRWKKDPHSLIGYKIMEQNNYHVGRMILTKQPYIFDPHGDADREDITYEYKDPEGTKGERLTFYKAVQNNSLASAIYDMPDSSEHAMVFSIKDIESINIAEPFSIIVEMENISNNPLTVEASLSAGTVYYNGVKAHAIKKASGIFKVKSKSKDSIRLQISADEYLDKLVEYSLVKIYAIATVKETKQTWAGEDDFQIMKPPLKIIAADALDLKRPTKLAFSFTNPLNRTLTQCQLIFEAPGLLKHTKMPFRDIKPEEDVFIEHDFTPNSIGEFKVVGIFHSKELRDVIGSAVLNVF